MKKYLKNDCTCILNFDICGISLLPGQVYEIPQLNIQDYTSDTVLLSAVSKGDIKVGWWSTSFYSDPIEGELYLRNTVNDNVYVSDGTTITEFTPSIETDPSTGIKGDNLFLNVQTMQREFYNDPTSMFYVPEFQPILGDEGTQVESDNRILNLENIHNKTGNHYREVIKGQYQKPDDVLIYYGWLNSFNYTDNSWNNELVAQDMSKYRIIVFADGIQDSSHGDYSNTQTIISRLKVLNPSIKIFGNVPVNQTLSNFQESVDEWEVLGVHGIFLTYAGYEYGDTSTNDREAFNTRVDYVHDTTSNLICFINSFYINHIIGTDNDPLYPNTTWNPNLLESTLTNNDYAFITSSAIDTTLYSGNNGYEAKTDWETRITNAINKRFTYGINLVAGCIINNDNSNGQDLFNFAYTSALMGSFEGFCSSDTSYGSSSATITYWDRPNTSNLGVTLSYSPSIIEDGVDSDIYRRKLQYGELVLDFSSGVQTSEIVYYSTQTESSQSSGSSTSDSTSSLDMVPFFVMDSSGGQSIISSDATLVLDSIETDNTNYSLSGNEVTVLSSGIYKIDYHIIYEILNSDGGATGTVTSWLENNSTAINGSYGRSFHDETSGGSGINSSIITSISANDVIRIRMNRTYGTTNIQTSTNYSGLSIMKVGN